ncbi:MAG TPA: SDR family NAD(P)-dependent oxidoreductase [Thermoanaerobaculia bacterium]|nr:SDR family NAD(P)-dependent oxidoreductase [Thermoanaerobaculia bacterium]
MKDSSGDIAVIGMSCRFPGAADPEQYWENLVAGRVSIGEVPETRWRWQDYRDESQPEESGPWCRWAGLIDDVDAFDAAFFNVSPREAESMDPQQRLGLELAWSCFEDAGMRPSHLSGRNVGVFLGFTNLDYKEIMEESPIDIYYATGTLSSVIPNRISWHFNLRGPSVAVDTACSSSLHALHLACRALRENECDTALAGGISLLLTPKRFIWYGKAGILSSTGAIRSFDENADGTVRGEGAGFLLLKPLERAIVDGNRIVGVIKGSAVNHGGKHHTLTYPSAGAQAEVVASGFRAARVTASEVSYVECHGTGTLKGDPIEVRGLLKAFQSDTADAPSRNGEGPWCGLGTVKPNIGHLEGAAGIAGVIKVLQALRHKTLPPSVNLTKVNSRIDLGGAVYFVDRLQSWEPRVRDGIQLPRIAGVSSFGFAGTNAHVVLAEAPVRQEEEATPAVAATDRRAIVVLSARDADRLKDRVRQLQQAISRRGLRDSDLAGITYTLQVGREPMDERLGFLVSSVTELAGKLQAFLDDETTSGLYRGSARKSGELVTMLAEDEVFRGAVGKWVEQGRLEMLLELWIKGLELDWTKLYGAAKPQTVDLPTYPFARTRFWAEPATGRQVAADRAAAAALHPLLHDNTSDLAGQCYGSTFTGAEFFLADHQVKTDGRTPRKVLPGVACLEMARAAVEKASDWPEAAVLELQNTVWTRPIVVDAATRVNIALLQNDDDRIDYEIYTGDGDEKLVACQGRAVFSARSAPATLDVPQMEARMARGMLDGESVYAAFARIGLAYGPAFRTITALHRGDGELLAHLRLPDSVADKSAAYVLHPGLLDGALQAAVSLDDNAGAGEPRLPFALETLRILSPCSREMLAWVRYASGSNTALDVDLCDDRGNICVQLHGFSSRVLPPQIDATAGSLVATPVWHTSALESGRADYAEHHIVLCGLPADELSALIPHAQCLPLRAGGQQTIAELYSEHAIECFERIKAILDRKPQGRVLFQLVIADHEEQTILAGLSALLKTAQLENPRLIGQVILVPPGVTAVELGRHLQSSGLDSIVRYADGARQVLRWEEVTLDREDPSTPLNARGVYLITGGLGGLGTLFAKEILERSPEARVVLTGRAELASDKRLGDRLSYRQVDLSDRAQVERLIEAIVGEHGKLSGILHCAGMIADHFIVKKSSAEFRQVLAPKVTGTSHLDLATRDVELDFFLLFSSIAGALGNFGQADYASANGFLDQFAAYRNRQVAAGRRHGRTRSINWPLWRAGGMGLDAAGLELLERTTGIQPMATATGLNALHGALSSSYDQLLVAEGDLTRIRRTLFAAPAAEPETKPLPAEIDSEQFAEKAQDYLLRELSAVLKLPAHSIDPQVGMDTYGIDSVLAMKLTNQLERTFGSLSKTLFFEYRTVGALSQYFIRSHADRLASLFAPKTEGNRQPKAAAVPSTVEAPATRKPGRRSVRPHGPSIPATESDPIAIIGLSGRYPEAVDVEAYWRNLRDGRDCIVEVPRERWDWREYFSVDRGESGRHYSKWGGFIEGVDEFDPLFFNISPKEAKVLDPQERLFLQHAWMAIEDAGYTRASLEMPSDHDLPGQVGVYAGVMYTEYQLLGAEASARGQRMGMAGSAASIANRVSYTLNLHGPSVTLDTMCSSSLTAIHFACEDLKHGRTAMAIAGGVNVSIHPNKYLLLSAGQFISSDGHCQSFGEGGDGYIPGEGVGVVVLKRLSEAKKDGDHIYGVIRGSALNHGGRTNGYTVPNPQAQASAIGRALVDAQIDARHVSYIEAHGTGTKLGDPIEIAALSQAFAEYTRDTQFCLIGSAKSNIGHCESAAGMAGLTKVLLQMQHQQIVPSLHSAELNPHVDFTASPFIVNQTLRPWDQPVAGGRKLPRIAGVSSFGAGGSNAHLIVEEYQAPAPQQVAFTNVAIVLSARTEVQLQQKVRDLLGYVRPRLDTIDLHALAYTLQMGREAMGERLGFVVSSMEQLADTLQAHAAGDRNIVGLYQGQVSRGKRSALLLNTDTDLRRAIDQWIEDGKLPKLLELWVEGVELDWRKLYGDATPQRVSLPVYPFAKERYWIDVPPAKAVDAAAVERKKPAGISLGAPGAPGSAASIPTGRAPVALPNAIARPGAASPVCLFDEGNGILAIRITAADNDPAKDVIASLVHALELVQQEVSVNALKIAGLERCFRRGGREDYNDALEQGLYRAIASFPYPTIAVLEGDTAGAAFLCAALCDLLVCSEDAIYRHTDAERQFSPTPAEGLLFSERFGEVRAQDFLYVATASTGRQLRAKGWTCTIVPPAQIEAATQRLAAALATKSQEALRLLKQHLTRHLGGFVDALQRVDAPALETAETVDATPIEAPGAHIRLTTPLERVLVISFDPGALQELVAALSGVYESSTYKAFVLVSTGPEFLPASIGVDAVLDLRRLIAGSAIPVVAALTGDARGDAWLIGQFCDAAVYSNTGVYSAAGIAQTAAPIFARRFGGTAAKEILFTGADYTGIELQERTGTLLVAERDQVVPAALKVAESWSKLPSATLAAWKKQTAAALPTPQAAEPHTGEVSGTLPAVPTPIALRSKVVKATAHPEGIVVVRLEDRDAKNMFSEAFMAGVSEVFAHIEQTPAYKVVVLTGYDHYFACGATQELLFAIHEGRIKFTDYDIYQLPLDCKVPVISAMQGHGIGAGWTLGLFADLVLLSEDSRYVNPYMDYGFTPGDGATWVFAKRVGHDLANESFLTALHYTGGELKKRGLRLPVLPQADVLPAAMALARRIAQEPRSRLAGIKAELTRHAAEELQETYRLEVALHDRTFVGRPDTLALIRNNFHRPAESPRQASLQAVATTGTDGLAAVTASLRTLLANELQLQERDADENLQFVDLGLDSVAGVSWVRKINELYQTSIEAASIYSHPTLARFSRYVKEEADKRGTLPLPARPQPPPALDRGVLGAVTASLKTLLADELQMRESDVDENRQFVDLGLDSVAGVSWIRKINEKYQTSIDAASIYSHPTLAGFSRHVSAAAEAAGVLSRPDQSVEMPAIVASRFISSASTRHSAGPIAIIGMAGQFPEASNLEEFWQNIAQGRNCISQVPPHRWDVNAYYQPGDVAEGKTISNWLGALADYDRFDPLFFNISPAEAESMDPQQRLFLQACWHSIENAGYDARSLSGTRCGVFAGCAYGDYHLLSREQQLSAQGWTGDVTSILAARISYQLNLQGPCLSIDTACSSSLVALAQACDSLVAGGSDLALAGGVYVMAGPEALIRATQSGMLSPVGRCFTFDQRADGFVPGEGVGVVLLKRLADAERDHDIIHAVIHGWGVNQDGRTNGITAPNPESQVHLEQEVYDRYQLDPSNIQLVEAHGTGTKLGDPIEVMALKQSFKKYTQDKNYCALGSVKSNIGHLSMAAGIAGLIKAVLALQHGQLPPTINFDGLNEHIDLNDSPFYVNTRLQAWEPKASAPRQAAVSSFGFSGTNAHVVVGEYLPAEKNSSAVAVLQDGKIIVPLSAKRPDQLKQKARDLLAFLRNGTHSAELLEIAYTLQVGREPMDVRVAFLVSTREQLAEAIEVYVDGKGGSQDFCEGQVCRGGEGIDLLSDDAETREAIVAQWIGRKKLSKLMDWWVKGVELDWNSFYGEEKPRRVALPGYPFARERYWIDVQPGRHTAVSTVATAVIHPLLHGNTSDPGERRYSSTFRGDEFFLADHHIKGEEVLPGVAYLEMVRAAVEHAFPAWRHSGVLELRNTVWMQPLVVTGNQQVSIALLTDGNEIEFEIYSADGRDEVMHCQGSVVLSGDPAPARLELAQLERAMDRGSLEPDCVYAAFDRLGGVYGRSFRAITAIHQGQGQLLARLRLPEAVANTLADYVLHPSLMDAALHGYPVLMEGWPDANQPRMPFAVESVRVIAPCTREMAAWVRYTPGTDPADSVVKLDVDLCDADGNVCVQLHGFSTRILRNELTNAPAVVTGSLLITPTWQAEATAGAAMHDFARHHVLVCEPATVDVRALESLIPRSRCLALQGGRQQTIAQRYSDHALACLEQLQGILRGKPHGKVLVQLVVVERDMEQALFAGLSGLLKTAALENPQVVGQVIVVTPEVTTEELAAHLLDEQRGEFAPIVRYERGSRRVVRWQEVRAELDPPPGAFTEGGVYLITGGFGKLGALFAGEILSQSRTSRVVLTGRSPLDAKKQALLENLSPDAGRVSYQPVDLGELDQVMQLVAGIVQDCGSLNGILHAAGMTADSFILKKTVAEFREVLEPKAIGTFNLDHASRDVPLDFFVLFSSIAGAMGNAGQADYAAANGFMDQFAAYRNRLVAIGYRRGRTRSIDWPLWEAGGMAADRDGVARLFQSTGMQPMQTATGLQAFHRILASPHDQVLAAEGNLAQMRRALLAGPSARPAVPARQPMAAAAIDPRSLTEKTQDYLCRQLSGTLRLTADTIDPRAPLATYGIDSILAMKLTSGLETSFGSLPKTLFFEYQTVRELTGYFVAEHPEQLAALFGRSEAVPQPEQAPRAEPVSRRRSMRRRSAAPAAAGESEPIAIIGLSGRYPEAWDIDALWRNLQEGKDCIVEVPGERWDWRDYYSDDRNEKGRHYSKWGGFIEGVDEFDPQFFNISPKEARYIDPQERLFLQHAWMAVEDAGYTRASLRIPQGEGLPGQVGVYAGVWSNEYQLFGAEASMQGERGGFAISVASIANRVSYAMNLHGPSIALDTMCSASLTGIHIACQDLRQERISLAIAGGVNVNIHPNKYLMLSAAQAISTDGHCRSFGEGGDGYIPAEGVGVVVLKRLSEAERDGDHIYGIIRGSALNHGGRTNGYTVPNPQAQTDAIKRALAESRVDPRHVSYIETHGTGTKLGDPIEIAALNKAFHDATQDHGYCAIGSVKSNIGHCESAAGIAGLTKVLLQMRHEQLVPSLHSETVNPHIDFHDSPFIISRSLRPWEQPIVDGRTLPRIAGISSFGASGANAHMIVEEYPQPLRQLTASGAVAILLSARTEVQLQQKARELMEFVRGHRGTLNLVSMAYTLQVGREAMEERLAFVVESAEQLLEMLQAFADGQNGEGTYQGQVKRNKEALSVFNTDPDLQQTVSRWLADKKLPKLTDLWVKGLDVDWDQLYAEARPRRMSLPAYPFARERHWVDLVVPVAKGARAEEIHPLLQSNVSDLGGQRYRSTFTGAELFLANRQVTIAAYLEMARAAVAHASPAQQTPAAIELHDIVCAEPLVVSGDTQVSISLSANADGWIDYEIYSGDAGQEVVHCQGHALSTGPPEPIKLDLEQLQVRVGVDQLLVHLTLPASLEGTSKDYVLHPVLLDGAVQACSMLLGRSEDSTAPRFAAGLETLRIVSPCSREMLAWVRHSATHAGKEAGALDIDFCDERGNVSVQLRGLSWQQALLPPQIAHSAKVREEIVFLPDQSGPAASIERKKPATVSLSALTAQTVRLPIAGEARVTLSDASHLVPASSPVPASSSVRLYDDGNGVFTIHIAASSGDALLSQDVTADLVQALLRLQQEASLKGLIVSGLEHLGDTREDYNTAAGQTLYETIASFAYPVIAILYGDTSGPGFLAAALCDFMVCSEDASYRYSNSNSGLFPTPAVLAVLSERFHAAFADDFLFRSTGSTGRQLRAKGWTCPILPAAEVEPYARTLGSQLVGKSSEALRLLKAHLSRNLRELVRDLTHIDAPTPEERRDGVLDLAPAAAYLHVETPVEHVLVISFSVREGEVSGFVSELGEIFARVRENSHYKAVVLVSNESEFLPASSFPENFVRDVQRLLAELPIPVAVALRGAAAGDAWLVALLCDACVYSRTGVYSSAALADSTFLSQTAAAVFTHRFGNAAGKEILLTGKDYSGADLQQHAGAVAAVEQADVLPTALQLAQLWTTLPRHVLTSWKQHAAAAIRETIDGSPAAVRLDAPDEPFPLPAPGPIRLRSKVVTATAHPDGIVVVKMEDREAKNMFSDAFVDGIREAFAHIEQTPAYKVVILTGYDHYFVSGGTREGLIAIQEGKARFTDLGIYHIALDCRLPVIAAMQGHGIGAGLAMGMFADVVLLADESRYVSPYMDYGFTPGAGATRILAHVIGHDLAREGLLTARYYAGSEWKERGVRLRILPRAEVYESAMALAREMAQQSRRRLIRFKQQLAVPVRGPLDETYRLELAMHEKTFVGQSGTLAQIESNFHDGLEAAAAAPRVRDEPDASGGSDVLSAVTATLKSLLAKELQLQDGDIDDNAQFADLGLESISGVTWIRKINARYSTAIEATRVYSHPTLAQLSRYVKTEAEKCGTLAEPVAVRAMHPPAVTLTSATLKLAVKKLTPPRRLVPSRARAGDLAPAPSQSIAIIGIAGQFPQANNLEEFWENLAQGRNCISRVPANRWDVDAFYQAGEVVEGKTNSQWLGALEEFDRFDPLFFNISPTEAENMDPQQRLFLQACWHSIESAGYDARALSGSRCGVFVGCTGGDYHQLSRKHQLSAQGFTGSSASILAARISYFLNLQGPCVSVDTACSASLVAVAQACDSLVSGGSDVALAGGVCVLTGPELHIRTAQAGMLSPEGNCFTFDQRADGFVPGEAVGVVMLKRLADAERDEDIIHAVIQGWGVNQDGKTNGITAPNPESQTRLETYVYDRYGIDPAGIHLVEAHGTGTKLGDPIEVEGLKNAFRKYTANAGYCALGSVKSNIGHCLTAAGIAGVMKVVLALKHKQLPPTVNFERLNGHIDLNDSPFYINTGLQEWLPFGGQRRQAAVSSFAFSGTNAHMVIGEYLPPSVVRRSSAGEDVIIPLSARTIEQLRQKASDLLTFIRREAPPDLGDIAYTLQVGRTAMEERLGFVVSSAEELAGKLAAYIAGEPEIGHFHQGAVRRNQESLIGHDGDLNDTAAAGWIADKELSNLLDLWVNGHELDWRRLYGAFQPRRITLPTYPFAKERHWIDTAQDGNVAALGAEAAAIHPLLHRNTSDLDGQRYTTAFTGNEFFLTDHRVRMNGSGPQKVLPAAAYLEIARAALEQSSPVRQRSGVVELRNTTWLKPVVVTDRAEISISLSPTDDGNVDYEIHSVDGDQEAIHCQGQAVFAHPSDVGILDLDRLRAEMKQGRLEAAEIYARFERMGLSYGPTHQGVAAIDLGEKQLLAQLRLPAAVEASRHGYVLHPGLIDSALQASIGLIVGEPLDRPQVPFLLDSLRIVSACTAEMFAWVRYAEGTSEGTAGKKDIDVCDLQGNVCVQMRGFTTRHMESQSGAAAQKAAAASMSKKANLTKQPSSFDRDFYENLMAAIARHEVTVDEALRLG